MNVFIKNRLRYWIQFCMLRKDTAGFRDHMGDQQQMGPTGVGRDQLDTLTGFANRSGGLSATELANLAAQHLSDTAEAHGINPMINLRLAQALTDSIKTALAGWDTLSATGKYWLAGAILYFSNSNDDEPDFDSPIGFEDDAEILNACLEFVGMPKLRVNPEDYDDV